MTKIIRNVSKILFKRKSFILTTFVLPICLIFLFTLLYGSNSTFKVAVINNDKGKLGEAIEDRLSEINGVKTVEYEDNDNYKEKLVFHQIELVIKINSDFTERLINGEKSEIKIESISKGDLEPTIIGVLENETKSLARLCNNINIKNMDMDSVLSTFKESKPNYEIKNTESSKDSINNSIGIILYLIFICAGISCGFLLEDEREGTKARILMGKINEKEYYGGMGAIFFLLTSIPAIEYYIVCRVLGHEFGFENKIILLGLLLLIVLLAVAFNIMLSSIIKKKNVLTLVNSALTIPIFMISGSFWPFDIMSEGLKKVGNALPPRWFFMALENLQSGKRIETIIPMILGIISIIILLFLLSIFFTRNKIVLVKEDI